MYLTTYGRDDDTMKETKPFNRLLALVLAVVIVAGMIPVASVHAADAWEVADDTDIFWVRTEDAEASYGELSRQVQLFCSELAEKITADPLDIVYGDDSEVGANDIILVLDSTSGIAAQGYVIAVEGTAVKISAADADGLFYGCRELIKQLLSGDVSDKADAPHVLERAVSLDNGRKYFTVAWIKEFIREMSWANMNALALHFSEEMGLGIESQLYPWLAGRDGTLCTQADLGASYDGRYLTQDEVAEIVEYARLYHVEIIPSLDSPGHMNYIVKKFNEKCAVEDFTFTYDGKTYTAEAGSEIGNYYHYNNQVSIVKGSRNPDYSRGIDISDEIAVAFTRSLIEEYAALFADLGCTKFDIGGDELLGWGSAITSSVSKWKQLDHWKAYAQERTGNTNAVAYDAFLLYMNDLNELVRELGYTSVRMWNDDALRKADTGWQEVVQLDTDIDIWFWTTGNNIFYDYAVADYQLYNIISDYNYYAMTSDYFSDNRSSFTQSYADEIYNEWTPYIFYPDDLNADWKHNPSTANPNVLGGAFGVWCDNPSLRTEEQVMSDLLPMIRANAAKSWDVDVNDSMDYDAFVANWNKLGSAPEGTVEAPDVYTGADLTALEAAVAAFEAYNASDYTAESYAAYEAAVQVGKALLLSNKPLQTEVDAAVEAIEAAKENLKKKTVVDPSALVAAVEAYENCNRDMYTHDSFAEYTAAVYQGRILLQRDDYTEESLIAALDAINDAVNGLVPVADDAVECVIKGSSKSAKVYIGKVANFTVKTEKFANVTGLVVYNDKGERMEPVRTAQNLRNAGYDAQNFIFKVEQDDVGTRTYTIYAIMEDGRISADSVQVSILVYD